MARVRLMHYKTGITRRANTVERDIESFYRKGEALVPGNTLTSYG